MKPITIVGSAPRCGSTLLVRSLAGHSLAKYAGEAAHPCWIPDAPGIVKLRRSVLGRVEFHKSPPDLRAEYLRQVRAGYNLCKLFPSHVSPGEFAAMLSGSCVVFIFRARTDKQLTSWEKAHKTGLWTNDGGPATPSATPFNRRTACAELVAGVRAGLHVADYVLTLERLTQDFDACVTDILTLAGWPIERLQPATEPQR
jgi:hypothetical protein